MRHIEFTGPAGSGKTTLVEKLTTDSESLFSKDEVIYKHFSPHKSTQTIISQGLLGKVMKLGWSRYAKYKYFFNFSRSNPDFVSNSISFIQSQRGKNNNKERSMMDLMSMYQLAQESIRKNDILVLDEGFYHKTAVHAKHGELPSNRYLASMPSPDILVHVDPPIKLARQRCKKRDGNVATREIYQKARRTKRELVSMAEELGVHVIEVENKKDIESEVSQIRSEISEITRL